MPLQSYAPLGIFLPPKASVNSINASIRRAVHGTVARTACGRRGRLMVGLSLSHGRAGAPIRAWTSATWRRR